MVAALAVTLAVGSTTALLAEVKTQQKTQVKFEGMLGRMMGMFGGKAAKEGVVNTVAVKGNRKITIGDAGGQIIDSRSGEDLRAQRQGQVCTRS